MKAFRQKGIVQGYVVSLVLFAWMITTLSAAEINEDQRKALNNLQHEIANCVMFYTISAAGLLKNGSPEALKSSKSASIYKDQMFETAVAVGSIIGMNEKAMTARFQMAFNQMMDEMDNNFVNYSILLQQHAKPCAELYVSMESRISEAIQ
tara:strand:- start:6086 stop:6538 length:453 start_codon:yes stop_codon:yes gene_type:complete